MFAISCPSHGSNVLVGSRRIRSLINTEAGIVLNIECYCGTHVAVGTGRKYLSRPRIAAAA
jgi:hypothetical protein